MKTPESAASRFFCLFLLFHLLLCSDILLLKLNGSDMPPIISDEVNHCFHVVESIYSFQGLRWDNTVAHVAFDDDSFQSSDRSSSLVEGHVFRGQACIDDIPPHVIRLPFTAPNNKFLVIFILHAKLFECVGSGLLPRGCLPVIRA